MRFLTAPSGISLRLLDITKLYLLGRGWTRPSAVSSSHVFRPITSAFIRPGVWLVSDVNFVKYAYSRLQIKVIELVYYMKANNGSEFFWDPFEVTVFWPMSRDRDVRDTKGTGDVSVQTKHFVSKMFASFHIGLLLYNPDCVPFHLPAISGNCIVSYHFVLGSSFVPFRNRIFQYR